MCWEVTAVIALCLVLLVPAGALAWLSFQSSVRKHRVSAGAVQDGLRDDAGLTAFERVHLRQVITNAFADQPNLELRALAAKTRARLLLSAGIAAVVVLLLLVRTSACS
jgi:hypothetical protein